MRQASTAALTVAELNEYARKLLAGDPLLRNLEVTGEISGYKHHYSGHRYFTLKDASARIQCVMFRQNAVGLDFTPADGMQVTLHGSVSIFVRDGSYQLYVDSMRKSGQGDLYARFERLKAKLQAEGLFDPARKREIPLFPKTIGLVTSETGAAVRDMIRVARRRNPNVGILIAPCSVQGASAVPEIVRSIQRLNAHGECDVLLVGRGGGSMEDLWAFNEEPVARAIAASRIPVISCVGHEIDFTIADFVADLRAPTPSAAAELAVPVLGELQGSLDDLRRRLAQALSTGQRVRRTEFGRICASAVLADPGRALLDPRRDGLERLGQRASVAMQRIATDARHRLDVSCGMLRTLNPESVIDRGYAVVMRKGKFVASAAAISPGEQLDLRMADGTVVVRAMDVKEKDHGQEKTDV